MTILDINEKPRVTVGDQTVRQYLIDHYPIFNGSQTFNVQALDKELRNDIIRSLLKLGAGFRQISRITGVPYGIIHRLGSVGSVGSGDGSSIQLG